MAVREQTALRAEKDRRHCEELTQQRMEYIDSNSKDFCRMVRSCCLTHIKIYCSLFDEQKKLMEDRFKLRKMHRARKRWRAFMKEFQRHLGKVDQRLPSSLQR